DILDGRAGADAMDGGAGDDRYYVDNALDAITDSSGVDTIWASVGYSLAAGVAIEYLRANAGSTGLTLTGNELNNRIVGGAGNNILEGRAGADTLDGAEGTDTASYAASGSGVNVSINKVVSAIGHGTGGDAEGDTLINIENLTGSTHQDVLEGDQAANRLDGG